MDYGLQLLARLVTSIHDGIGTEGALSMRQIEGYLEDADRLKELLNCLDFVAPRVGFGMQKTEAPVSHVARYNFIRKQANAASHILAGHRGSDFYKKRCAPEWKQELEQPTEVIQPRAYRAWIHRLDRFMVVLDNGAILAENLLEDQARDLAYKLTLCEPETPGDDRWVMEDGMAFITPVDPEVTTTRGEEIEFASDFMAQLEGSYTYGTPSPDGPLVNFIAKALERESVETNAAIAKHLRIVADDSFGYSAPASVFQKIAYRHALDMEARDKAYSLLEWGSHPDADNDDCWTGTDFATIEQTREALKARLKSGDMDVAYFEIDGPGEHGIYTNPSYDEARAKRLAAEDDANWRNEQAMQAGMAGGCAAYNEALEQSLESHEDGPIDGYDY